MAGGKETLGVNNVSFSVEAGEVVALVGPSGCGKTTILKMAAGILEPSRGSVSYGNLSVERARTEGRIGYVPQQSTLLPFKTVIDNIRLPLDLKGSTGNSRDLDLLNSFGLTGFENHFPSQLSGGMQQRVAIARAFLANPQVLLLDEPFASVDELLKERLNEELVRVHSTFGTTILYVTHNLEEAVFLANRILVFGHAPGSVIADVPIKLPSKRSLALRSEPSFYNEVIKVRASLRSV